MKPSEIRKELVAQHAEIATLVVVCGEAIDSSLAAVELQAHLRRLADAVHAHNDREEFLLRELIAKVDAWGPTRVSLMDEHHTEEHDRIESVLRAASPDFADVELVGQVRRVLQHVLVHMKTEEGELLSPDILRDDIVALRQTGG